MSGNILLVMAQLWLCLSQNFGQAQCTGWGVECWGDSTCAVLEQLSSSQNTGMIQTFQLPMQSMVL